jgi:hypothetical protein
MDYAWGDYFARLVYTESVLVSKRINFDSSADLIKETSLWISNRV